MELKNKSRLAVVALLLVGAVAAGVWYFINYPKTRSYDLGLVTWIGYAPFLIADEKGLFAEAGVEINVRMMDGHGLREAAYLSGSLDFFPNTPDAFVILFSEHEPSGKLVAALDESSGGDGIIAKKTVQTLADLKGKTIGFQDGITSHFLLLYALKKAGIKGNEVIQENLEAGDAGAAFLAGKIDAAVTWEPWLTKANETENGHVLVTSANYPGLIADVMLVSERVLRDDPNAFRKVMAAWHKAIKFMNEHPQEARAIVARKLGETPDGIEAMLKTVKFYSEKESAAYLRGSFEIIADAANQLYLENGVTKKPCHLKSIIDPALFDGSPH
jgi:NitT/TauT family transport system substrate-binding protein